MEKQFGIHELIRYFTERLRRQGEENICAFQGEGPMYPMTVVYLGEKSVEAHKDISRTLTQVWPPFQNEICYMAIRLEESGTGTFCRVEKARLGEPYTGDEFYQQISALFQTDRHYADYSKMEIFFILDAAGVESVENLAAWLNAASALVNQFQGAARLVMLGLLLDENLARMELATQIHNSLGAMLTDGEKRLWNYSAFLISNRRNDNQISRSEDCRRILADVMLLANSHDGQAAGVLFERNVKTAGFALVEKPSGDIAQVAVAALIRRMDLYRVKNSVRGLWEDEKLKLRLGFETDGTFSFLKEYVDAELAPLLPKEEELELFPRKEAEEWGRLEKFSVKEFDEMTMGAWNCYLEQIAGEAERALENEAWKNRWKQEYNLFLKENFTADELIQLADNRKSVLQRIIPSGGVNQGGTVLSSALRFLDYRISANPVMLEFFLNILADQAEEAGGLIDAWKGLTQSLGGMFGVHDGNVTNFYEKQTQMFFDRNDHEIQQRFRHLKNADELWDFLTEIIDRMVGADKIYGAAFEDELKERLDMTGSPADVRRYIRSRLTGDRLHVYLHVGMALDMPVVSAVFLRLETGLHKSLKESLDSHIRYWDTGRRDAAEALDIYQVGPENLMI